MQAITGQEVRKWREDRGVSRAKLGRMLSTPVRTIENWENGPGSPPAFLRLALLYLARRVKKTVINQDEVPDNVSNGNGDIELFFD